MAYGFRDGGSPLIDLIQSYRQEQLVRDKMRMDELNTRDERRYRDERDAVADKRYTQEYNDGIAQYAQKQNDQRALNENAMKNDNARTSIAQETFNLQKSEREALSSARQGVVSSQEADTNDYVSGLQSRLDSLREANGGLGHSGQTQGIELEEDGDDYRVHGLGRDGVKRAINNNDRSDDPAKGMRIKKSDLPAIQQHLDRVLAGAAEAGRSPAEQQVYARASVTQDPETNYARIATAEEFPQNLRSLMQASSVPAEPTAEPVSAPAEPRHTGESVDDEFRQSGEKIASYLPSFVENGVRAVSDSPVFKGAGKGIASFVADVRNAQTDRRAEAKASQERVAEAFTPRAFKSTNKAVAVKPTGEPIVAPKSTPDDVISAKKEAEQQGIQFKQAENEAQIGELERQLAYAQSATRRQQAWGKLYVAGGINEEQYRNASLTGNVAMSPEQMQADARAAQVSIANIRKSNMIETKTLFELKKLVNESDGDEAKLLKETRAVFASNTSSLADSLFDTSNKFGKAERDRAVGAIDTALTHTMAGGRFKMEAMGTVEMQSLFVNATKAAMFDIKKGEEVVTLDPYLTGVENKYVSVVASRIKGIAAQSVDDQGRARAAQINGKTVVVNESLVSELMTARMDKMRTASGGALTEAQIAQVTDEVKEAVAGMLGQ